MTIYDPISAALGLPELHITYDYNEEYVSKTIHRAPVNKGRPMSEEQKEILSKINSGKTLSEEHKRKIGLAGKGRKPTPETRKKLSDALKNHFKSSVSDITREKMRQAKLGKKKQQKICPYCNLGVAPNLYERWHNKNCKQYDARTLE